MLILQKIMRNVRYISISLLLVLGALIVGCSGYETILESNNPTLKYKKAFDYFESEEYSKSSTLFEQLVPIYKGTEKAPKIQFFYGKSLYQQRKYVLASYHFQQTAQNYPESEYSVDAMFLKGMCYYQLSPEYRLDQKYTKKAITVFNNFIKQYPSHSKAKECRDILNNLHNKLAKKAFHNAKLYYELEDYEAALVAFNNCLEEYPKSKYREKIKFLLVKSNYLLAKHSVQEKQRKRYQNTIDNYYSFINEFEDSEYLSEAKKIYDKSKHILEN